MFLSFNSFLNLYILFYNHLPWIILFIALTIQGPFRNPKEVQLQRYKPSRLTLRMETDFYHLEKARKQMKNKEWTQRLHDNM